MTSELGFFEEGVLPHSRNFLWRILESRPQPEIANAEIVVSVVNGNSQGGTDFVPHEFFLLLERVLLSGAVELRPLDGADRNDWKSWWT